MTINQFMAGFFSCIWELFSINIPVLDMSFGTFALGLFAIRLSVFLFRMLLGGSIDNEKSNH